MAGAVGRRGSGDGIHGAILEIGVAGVGAAYASTPGTGILWCIDLQFLDTLLVLLCYKIAYAKQLTAHKRVLKAADHSGAISWPNLGGRRGPSEKTRRKQALRARDLQTRVATCED